MTKKAFTLAEVLITLGIIGVVAAMTLPSLINDSKRKETSARLKKFYSTMSQAIIMSENENGPAGDWSKDTANREEDGTLIDMPDSNLKFFQKYIAPYMNITEIGKKDYEGTSKAFAAFADGSIAYFINGNCLDIIFDSNGTRKPNQEGKDRFRFLFCTSKFNESHIGHNKYFGTYMQDLTIEKGREYTKGMCKKNRYYCATLLLLDDWEFKEDYPY